MGRLTLLLGGARSGKSRLAVEWGRRHAEAGGGVLFVATATRLDDDMERRIDRHRAERPDWPTIEDAHDIAAAVEGHDDDLVIVDCLTLWVSNLTLRGDDEARIIDAADANAAVLGARRGPSVVISNEVGMGIHPDNELSRRYRDMLGHVNQVFAAAAEQTLLLVAGGVLALDDPRSFEP